MSTLNDLTKRQTDILQLVAKGLSNKEIANLLDISVNTVKVHMGTLLRSLNVANRTEAVFTFQQMLADQQAADALTAEPNVDPDDLSNASDDSLENSLNRSSNNSLNNSSTNSSDSPINNSSKNNSPATKPALAILPFENLSEAAHFDHIGESIAEELSIRMASHRWLPIISFRSSRRYTPLDDLTEAANKLGAYYLVTGTVRWNNDQLRLTCELSHPNDHRALWRDVLSYPVDNIMSAIDGISKAIAAALNFEVVSDQASLPQSVTGDVWHHAMRGMWQLHQRTPEANQRAMARFQACLELDDRWALSYCGLAMTLYQQHLEQWPAADNLQADSLQVSSLLDRSLTNRSLAKSSALDTQSLDDQKTEARQPDAADKLHIIEQYALTSIRLDPQMADGHVIYALMQMAQGQMMVAVQSLQQAVRLNPSFAHAHSLLGQIAGMAEQYEQAIEHLEYALQLNPRDPERWSYFAALAMTRFAMGDYSGAIRDAGESLSFGNASAIPHIALIASYAALGEQHQVVAACNQFRQRCPGFRLIGLQQMLKGAKPEALGKLTTLLQSVGID
ncbi:LuxR C-terminal-related transcriptional regulator [Pleionea mediterranea]|uniref:TolB-like protein n=1 Tax=Pleionea mediterranea TaxID=523701 RepID=A0A316FI29_9GAMM|nr:LuxR C-terminal-related transcriptional regulator [Pleionea mediterranea]PWK47913.1 TolB-like protein [Pleionea mediterranea]